MSIKKSDLKQEINGSGQHRLLYKGKPVTLWAGYTTWTYYKGFVGHTAYYGVSEAIITADEFCKNNGVSTTS